ncbi:MAG TPA: DUF6166 domain-containing protein [Conexibacter sp.]|nr:DUF6166 domain-containing protein [Conexibacter sp.]
MPRRYVNDDADLPDHDLILELPGSHSGLTCHVRHYVHRDAHVVIVGELADGASPIVFAEPIARELAHLVVPSGQEFTMVAYVPQHPLSGEPHFREVTFEIDGSARRPSSAVFAGPKVTLPCFRPLDLDLVEAMAGRPVFTFPYGFYTSALAEAMNGQPAKRLLELLIEAGLACPTHGPSRHGEYCGVDPSCDEVRNRRARRWRVPFEPRRRSTGGAYVGISTDRSSRVVFDADGIRSAVPVFGMDAPEVAWGYGGAGPWEAATSILADYLGFLPWPELRGRFKGEVVAHLPRDGFVLPVAKLDAWYDEATPATRPGLVVVAGPRSLNWPAGGANPMAGAIGRALSDAGFDVYEPGRNAEAPSWTRNDRRLHGMLHASLLSALDLCSMLVVPYDGHGIVHGVESMAALWYALEHPGVPCLIAYEHAEMTELADFERFGVEIAKIEGAFPPDVGAVLAAVDRACAAYECLHLAAGSRFTAAT